MAHAYTPGLKVTKNTQILRRRILPLKGDVVVQKGDEVTATQVVARTFLPGKVFPVNLANKFSMPPEEIPGVMKVQEGDPIEPGQLLAETQGIFGFFKSDFVSPVEGTLESLSKVTGQIMLREPPTPIEVGAYISGKVVEVIAREGVVVEAYGSLIQGIFGIGGEKEGIIHILADSPKGRITPDQITSAMAGQVLVGGATLDLETYQKASEMGVAGLVVGGFDDTLIKAILGYDIGVAITGSENLTTTLIMTEGFGEIPMANKTFELLKELEGKQASLNGSTQIRAGVLRPEIIVPIPESKDRGQGEAEEGLLEVGHRVRIIREPYFGQLGTVADLPSKPFQIETEAKVRILTVTLSDEKKSGKKGKKKGGKTVTLPRANVELIEE